MLTNRPWKSEALVLLFSGLCFGLVCGGVASLLLQRWAPGLSASNRAFANFLISTSAFQVLGLVLAGQYLRDHDLRWREFLGLTSERLRQGLLWAGIACAPAVVLTLELNRLAAWVITLFHHTPADQPTIVVLQQTIGMGPRLIFGFTAIIVAPIAEEVLFRGILYPFFKQHVRLVPAVILTSILFGASHMSIMTFVPLAFFSVVLIALYEHTDTLLAPILTHSFFNAVNFTLFILGGS